MTGGTAATPQPVGKSGLRRTVNAVGGGLGCLLFLVAFAVMVVGVLGIFFGDPTFWIAVVALLVAVSALKASRRGR